MFKKTVTYKDFNDNDVTEDLYFHLSKSELAEWAADEDGGMDAKIKAMSADNPSAIMSFFKELVRRSYGMRSEDGSKFFKPNGLADDFMQSAAYDALFWELVTNAAAATDFTNKLLPKEMQNEIGKLTKNVPLPKLEEAPEWEKEGRLPTKKELLAMGPDEMRRAMAKMMEDKTED